MPIYGFDGLRIKAKNEREALKQYASFRKKIHVSYEGSIPYSKIVATPKKLKTRRK